MYLCMYGGGGETDKCGKESGSRCRSIRWLQHKRCHRAHPTHVILPYSEAQQDWPAARPIRILKKSQEPACFAGAGRASVSLSGDEPCVLGGCELSVIQTGLTCCKWSPYFRWGFATTCSRHCHRSSGTLPHVAMKTSVHIDILVDLSSKISPSRATQNQNCGVAHQHSSMAPQTNVSSRIMSDLIRHPKCDKSNRLG